MRALVFGGEPQAVAAPEAAAAATADAAAANPLLAALQSAPMALREVPEPVLPADDWVVLRSRLTGICGSDTKQVFMDMGGDTTDLTMTAFISFPQVLGHEVVADVVAVGPAVRRVEVGQRVVLNCWLTCAPRGIDPPCPACRAGDLSQCWNFTHGRLAPGIHTGNSRDAPGGFADQLPAHETMVFSVPDEIPDEVAVLADPFAVSLHAVTRNPPPDGSRAVVWGAGALGTTSVAILRALYPTVDVAAVALHPAQQDLARELGAHIVDARADEEAIVRSLAAWSGAGELLEPWDGLPVAYPGRIETIYDTIALPRTLEAGLRVLANRGTIVASGVSGPGAFAWGPWYFKEARLVGSNAFGIEEVDGVRRHAIEHYLELVRRGRVDISAMLTHTFRLEDWRAAFGALADQDASGAIKVAFDFR